VREHRTGDLARIDAGGITLLGRAKDMIIRGEYNIYPALYEPAFDRLPGVRRSAMIGIPDHAGADERVVVVVEPANGVEPLELERTVYNALRSGKLAIDGFARPDHVVALAIPEAGRSSKADKATLRRLVLERLR
jgi:acyl-CoA synthetase (AMP-forming)/AMP-acid ligase II